MNVLKVYLPVVLGLVTLGSLVGCDRSYELGPFYTSVTALQSVEVAPEDFPSSKTDEPVSVTLDLPVIYFPSTDDMEAMIEEEIPGIIGRHASPSRLLLDDLTATATTGDFSWIRSCTVSWIADDGAAPVTLGTADSDTGFGTSLAITPVSGVDLLDLAPTGNEASGYPKVRFELYAFPPDSSVIFDLDLGLDVYVVVSF